MYYDNGRGMATLIQQKNCMKTLTNGGVNGGGANGSSNSATGQAVQQTRMLLPHEMVGLTTAIPVSSVNSSSTGISSNCYGSTQQIFEQIPQQQNQNQTIHTLGHNQVNNIQQFSRYFPQFHSNDSNQIYMATTSSNSGNHINTNSHIFVTNTLNTAPTVGTTVAMSTTSVSQQSSFQQSPLSINKQTTTHQQPPNPRSDSSAAQFLEASESQCQSENSNGRQGQENDCNKSSAVAVNGVQQPDEEQDSEPEIDIVINNVVCSFSVRCHLNLRDIALNGFNVEFRRENGMVTMKLRRPYTTASIWSSGRITCTGATSEEQAKIAARRYARCLQKLGFRVRFHNFRVVNVLGTCSMPWAIKIVNFSEKYKKEASYEPELHPGVTYKLRYPKATLKIFSTGSITVTAGSVAFVQAAIEHIYPLVYEFRKKRTPEEIEQLRSRKHEEIVEELATVEEEAIHSPSAKRRKPLGLAENDPSEDIMNVSDYEVDDPEEEV